MVRCTIFDKKDGTGVGVEDVLKEVDIGFTVELFAAFLIEEISL